LGPLAGKPFPEVVVVGQDFSDETYFEQQLGRENLLSHTNILLKSRLNELGSALDFGDKGKQHRLFFTNAVLCLKTKEAGMQGPVSKNHSATCSEKFLKPLLEILKPRIIIALGEVALNAVRQTQNLPK
jgi:hypothetical protein